MNDNDYFSRFMITKKELKIIKDQQSLYLNLEKFLNHSNCQYCFFEAYLKKLQAFYKNVIHERDLINIDNLKNLEQMLMGLEELRITHNIRQYIDDCMIMDIKDMNLLYQLNDYFDNEN
jgi:hypothetical protein